MQTREISKVDVVSAGKVLAAIFGVFGLIYGIFFGLGALVGLISKGDFSVFIIGIGISILAPLGLAVFGFIEGLILSLVYNFAAGRFGGLKYEVKSDENESVAFSNVATSASV